MDVDIANVAESSAAAAVNPNGSDPTVSPSIKHTRTLFPQSDAIAPLHLHSSPSIDASNPRHSSPLCFCHKLLRGVKFSLPLPWRNLFLLSLSLGLDFLCQAEPTEGFFAGTWVLGWYELHLAFVDGGATRPGSARCGHSSLCQFRPSVQSLLSCSGKISSPYCSWPTAVFGVTPSGWVDRRMRLRRRTAVELGKFA